MLLKNILSSNPFEQLFKENIRHDTRNDTCSDTQRELIHESTLHKYQFDELIRWGTQRNEKISRMTSEILHSKEGISSLVRSLCYKPKNSFIFTPAHINSTATVSYWCYACHAWCRQLSNVHIMQSTLLYCMDKQRRGRDRDKTLRH